MAKFDANSTLKRLQNRYRLVVMNDDTYEEVVTFKLSRLSVYIVLSTIFVLVNGSYSGFDRVHTLRSIIFRVMAILMILRS